MKSRLAAILVLVAFLVVGSAGCGKKEQPAIPAPPAEQKQEAPEAQPSVPQAEEKKSYADGVYEASGQGWGGQITIEVTVSGGAITHIEIVESSETESIGGAAYGKLISEALAVQGVDIDVVSAATVTSQGFIEALGNALSQAAR
jgi:uncharacterized protein with FMN-binding domain